MHLQVRRLVAAAGTPKPVHEDEPIGDPELVDQREQLVVPPHGQEGLRSTQRVDRVEGGSSVLTKAGLVQAPAVGLVEDVVELLPFRLANRSAVQVLVEPSHRTRIAVAIVLHRDRLQPGLAHDLVDRPDDDMQVVEEGSVPVPDDVQHGMGG